MREWCDVKNWAVKRQSPKLQNDEERAIFNYLPQWEYCHCLYNNKTDVALASTK